MKIFNEFLQFKDYAVTEFAEGTVRSRKDVIEQQADDDGRTRRKKRKIATIIELRRTKKIFTRTISIL